MDILAEAFGKKDKDEDDVSTGVAAGKMAAALADHPAISGATIDLRQDGEAWHEIMAAWTSPSSVALARRTYPVATHLAVAKVARDGFFAAFARIAEAAAARGLDADASPRRNINRAF